MPEAGIRAEPDVVTSAVIELQEELLMWLGLPQWVAGGIDVSEELLNLPYTCSVKNDQLLVGYGVRALPKDGLRRPLFPGQVPDLYIVQGKPLDEDAVITRLGWTMGPTPAYDSRTYRLFTNVDIIDVTETLLDSWTSTSQFFRVSI
jgi:hypothetical protein